MDEQWAGSLARKVAAGDREAFDELMRHFIRAFCGQRI